MCRLFNSFIIPRNVKRYSEFPARYKFVSEIRAGEDIVKVSERLSKEVNENFRSFYYLPEVSRIVRYSNYLYRKELRRGTDLSDYQEKSTEDLIEDYFINYLNQFDSDELDIIAQEVYKTYSTREYKDFCKGEVMDHFDKARRRYYRSDEDSRESGLDTFETELKDFYKNLSW